MGSRRRKNGVHRRDAENVFPVLRPEVAQRSADNLTPSDLGLRFPAVLALIQGLVAGPYLIPCIVEADDSLSRRFDELILIMDVFELTRKLIGIQSISGDEEDAALFIAEYLNRAGFEVEIQQVEEHRPNVYARRGDPDVVLSTHTDTVPPYVGLREDDQYIYGRGACDTKGIIASMIKSAERLVQEGVGDFGLLFVVGEEAGSAGARAANRIPNRCRYLINGEPTESKMALGSKGALKGVVAASGRAAHSAYPEMGESAIEKLLDILADLRTATLPRSEILGPASMNIGAIKGGVAANVVPPAAEAELMFRVVTDCESIKQIVGKVVAGRAAIEYLFECEPVFMEAGLGGLDGVETTVVAFTTDIPKLTNWGKPLLFGPGSILDAHTPNEKISKSEMAHAVDIYADLVVRLKKK